MNDTSESTKQIPRFRSQPRKSIPTRLVAGALGGLAAAYATNQFQALWATAARKISDPQNEHLAPEGEDATVLAASAISRHLFNHEMSQAEKKWAGPTVHYALGRLWCKLRAGAILANLACSVPGRSD